ncbi:MAG: flavodoxin family protein [Methanomassiliicoccales archaeon]|nr:flavodoxin family protein [Methanomassiliicoccales archaeon]
MKLVAVNGSPRKNGNTAVMLKEIVSLAEKKGIQTSYFDLVDLKIADCKGCQNCKTNPVCAQKDDMLRVIEAMQESEFVLLGSPVYMGDETGLMKCMADRLYCLLAPGESDGMYKTRLAPGKKVMLLMTCGLVNGDKLYNYILTRYFKLLVKLLEFDDYHSYIIGGVDPNIDVRKLRQAKGALEEADRYLTI